MMARKSLIQAVNIAQLSEGYVGKILDKALLDVCNDIDDRPDGKARKIVLTLTVKAASEGRVKITPEVAVKMPSMVPPDTVAKIDMNAGGFIFNPDVSDNPDQKSLHDIVDEAA